MTTDAGNIPRGPILKGGNKTRKRKAPKAALGVKWPSGSIVYICGISFPFGPLDTMLGGSEQAVVNLSECWAAAGKLVVVYGTVPNCIKNGVEYRSIHKLNLADTFDCAIVWRSNGVRLLPLINARIRIVDLHDLWDPVNYTPMSQLLRLTDMFMVKSEYHRNLYPYIPKSKIKVLMNGVQVDLFKSVIDRIPESDRIPHRCIYASSYDRGLEPILKYTWPIIKAAIPDATFDIYYGINTIAKTPMGDRLKTLFKQPGVKEHGRVSLEQVAKEKATSAIQLYISNCATEIDCISVRESLLCGSVPVLGNDYVFKERDGVHVAGSTDKPSTYKKAAGTVIRLLKDPAALEKKRQELLESKTIIPWKTVAEEWLKVIQRV